jgi:hypothetical protein
MANKSVTEHLFEVPQSLMKMMGGGPGGNTGTGKKNEKNLAQQLKRLAGIDLGLGALLKQSQIFTGYMGNLFAIVGAIIDTVLAPLAPLAFKALAALGKKIPAISAAAEKHIPRILDRATKIVQGFDGFMKKWWPNWAGTVAKIVGGLVAINLTLRMIRMSGSMAMSVTGARGIAGGVSKLLGRGGPVTQAAAATNVPGGGWAASGLGGGGRQISAKAAKQASYGQDLYASAAKKAAPAGVVARSGAQATATGSRFATAGRMARMGATRGVPIIGAAVAAGFTYSDSRNQGMSKGRSAARTGSTIAGGAIGAGLGSLLLPGIGTVAGGALGAMAGPMIFDAIFGKGKDGGGGSSNVGVGSGIGMSGYSIPTFVAESAEAFSKTVLESKTILDDYAVTQAALKLASEELRDEFNYAKEAVGLFDQVLRNYRPGVVDKQLEDSDGTLGDTFDGGEFVPKGALKDSGGIGQVDDGGLGGGTDPNQTLFPTNPPNYDFAAQRARSRELERQENARIESERMMRDEADHIREMELAALAGMDKPKPGYDTNELLNNSASSGVGTLGDFSPTLGSRIAATGGLGQQDDGSGGYASTDHIVINVYNASGNQVHTTTADKVGSAWAGTYGGEQEWM